MGHIPGHDRLKKSMHSPLLLDILPCSVSVVRTNHKSGICCATIHSRHLRPQAWVGGLEHVRSGGDLPSSIASVLEFSWQLVEVFLSCLQSLKKPLLISQVPAHL